MRNIQLVTAKRATPLFKLVDDDIADSELLSFALEFAGTAHVAPLVSRLIDEFGDVEIILATGADELRSRAGLSSRAVAILKLLHSFRADNRRGQLLN